MSVMVPGERDPRRVAHRRGERPAARRLPRLEWLEAQHPSLAPGARAAFPRDRARPARLQWRAVAPRAAYRGRVRAVVRDPSRVARGRALLRRGPLLGDGDRPGRRGSGAVTGLWVASAHAVP